MMRTNFFNIATWMLRGTAYLCKMMRPNFFNTATSGFKASTLVLLCLSACLQPAGAQIAKMLMAHDVNMIESRYEKNSRQQYEQNYYNNDWCDYYLYRENDKSYNLHPEKNTVFTVPQKNSIYNPAKEATRYRYYRGAFPEHFNINTPYALPVKNGTKTAWRTDRREAYKTLNFKTEKGDTIYATRGGTVCKTPSSRLILVYHADHTFAVYTGLRDKFATPGDKIRTAQPIGTAGQDNISISFFFLDKNKFDASGATGYPYSHFVPTFRTDKGDVRPDEHKFYRAATDDALIMQDMSKKEQKKYLKNK